MPNTPHGTRVSVSQKIEAALLDDIAAGLIQPGERLDETRLATRFSASRTPVREALNRLTAQGVTEVGESRGVRVSQYTREELAQMFEAMHEIEALCARLVAQRLTLLAKSRLEAAQAACHSAADAGDFQSYLRANEALHFAIYEATGNPYIEQLASDFRRRTGPFRAKKFATKADLVASAKSHDALLEKIFSADSNDAFDYMRKHMEESFMRVLAVS